MIQIWKLIICFLYTFNHYKWLWFICISNWSKPSRLHTPEIHLPGIWGLWSKQDTSSSTTVHWLEGKMDAKWTITITTITSGSLVKAALLHPHWEFTQLKIVKWFYPIFLFLFFFFFSPILNINFRCNSLPDVCVLQKVFVSKYMFCSGNYPSCTVIQDWKWIYSPCVLFTIKCVASVTDLHLTKLILTAAEMSHCLRSYKPN